jgi:ABC-type transport system involved in cytochrome bd biosynthesis fused ATPase/permease subunit
MRLVIGHSRAVRLRLNGRTVAIGMLAVLLALVLGGWAGTQVGAAAGAAAALASLVPSAVLAVFVELRQRNVAHMKRRQEVLRKYAPPKATDDREGEE